MNIDLIKAKVLDLAIKGQLVEQRDDEKLSDEILSLPNIEGPFEIPNNWKWININKVTNKGLQKKPNKDFIYIDVSSIDNKTGKIINRKLLKPSNAPSRARKIVSSGAILYSMVRPYLKNICVVQNINEETIASTAFAVLNCKNNIVNTFLYRVLLSSYFNQYVSSKQKGISYPAISESDFLNAPIPYPPLKEQNRIVKKVEEIFSILDALKDHQTILLSKLDLIRKVAIDKAIKGQLVEQRDDEKLSDEILNLPNIEGHFNIPDKWKFVELKHIGKIIGGGTPKSNKEYWEPGVIAWLRPADFSKLQCKFISHGEKFISEEGLKKSSAKLMPKGSVIFSSRAPIGYVFITQNDVSTSQGCKSVIPDFNKVTSDWIYYSLIAATPEIKQRASGTTFLEISGSKFGETKISLPPLQEQHRIVQKLEEILSTVSTIKNFLKNDKA